MRSLNGGVVALYVSSFVRGLGGSVAWCCVVLMWWGLVVWYSAGVVCCGAELHVMWADIKDVFYRTGLQSRHIMCMGWYV